MNTKNIDRTTGQYVVDMLEDISNSLTELGRTGNLNINKVSDISRQVLQYVCVRKQKSPCI